MLTDAMLTDHRVTTWRNGLTDPAEYDAKAGALQTEVERVIDLRNREAELPTLMAAIDRELVTAEAKERTRLIRQRGELMIESASMSGQISEARRRSSDARRAVQTYVAETARAEEWALKAQTADDDQAIAELSLTLKRQESMPFRMQLREQERSQAWQKLGDLRLKTMPAHERAKECNAAALAVTNNNVIDMPHLAA